MAQYTVDLRQIIYHYSQEINPLNTFKDIGGYKFIDNSLLPTIEDRISVAKNKILKPNIPWYNSEMANEFWEQFCARNLMREIEYETVDMFILGLNANIKGCVNRYNISYRALSEKIEPFIQYEETITRDKVTNGESSSQSEGTSEGNGKTVFEDTPMTSLGNEDYATNITQINNDNSSSTSDSGYSYLGEDEDISRKGRRDSQAKLINELISALRDVIVDMVEECSQRIFLKIY